MKTALLDTPRPVSPLRQPAKAARRGLAGPFWAPLLLSLVALALFWAPGANELLEYDRQSLLGGELWRIVTGHFVHRSVQHLGWDVLAFALLAGLCAQRRPRATWWALAVATLTIPLVLLFFVPGLTTYRGLSGLDSALFVLAALLLADEGRRAGRWRELVAPAAALVVFVGKVGYESITGSAWFAPPAAPGEVVVPLAHLVGAAAALLVLVSGVSSSSAPAGCETLQTCSRGASSRESRTTRLPERRRE